MATAAVDTPIFFIADGDRRGVAASNAYCDLIGRDRSAIVGHSWEEWVTPEEVQTSSARCARAMAGPPQHFVRRFERADGTAVTLAGTSSHLMVGRKSCLLASIHLLFAGDDLHADRTEHQAEVALYVEAIAGGLASIVAGIGLAGLRDSLNSVAGEAAELAANLSHRHRLQLLS